MISVIIPTLGQSAELGAIRAQLGSSARVTEVILVAPATLKDREWNSGPLEKVVYSPRPGRGYALQRGLESASASILLFLHDDTYLPPGWDLAVVEAFRDARTAGGAFRMRFEPEPGLLRALRLAANQLTRITHEFWGDHAIFIRRDLLASQPRILDVPIMEDVRLSRFLRRSGRTALLPFYVRTDPQRIIRNGILRQSAKNMLLRLAYGVGVSPEKIYRWYYREG